MMLARNQAELAENNLSSDFYEIMQMRRSCRHFVKSEDDLDVLTNCIRAAGTAPSGGNTQPWFFAIVTNPELRTELRRQAEIEEKEFYLNRASEEYLNDLSVFKTNWIKPHLTEAGALVVIFAKTYNHIGDEKKRCYYPRESTGIATGLLISALHLAGYDSLTHTPSPMLFLNKLLNRPADEKPFLILAVGKRDTKVPYPQIKRKSLDEISQIY